VKVVTYDAGRGARVGRLDDARVVDVGFDGDMVAFIEAGAPIGAETEVDDARLLAPLRPRTLRDFLTFEGHMQNALGRLGLRIPDEWYTTPAYYKGIPSTVIGPDDEIPWPSYTNRLDHELELAAVIGAPGRDIPTGDALEHIFGWTIWNDVSARDVQAGELKLGLGPAKAKDWDGSNVLGPCIVTRDELDASNLGMVVRVNGETWGEDSSANMHYGFADLIAYSSLAQMLYPGEVLGSGTAGGGSGLELDRWLQPGDEIELEIDGIGILRNRVGTKGA
jgi:2-keto-4-pentenoate hydratase/2-oxohepta-3-ene-1,7-dioic acid hydratase in catechol pathway